MAMLKAGVLGYSGKNNGEEDEETENGGNDKALGKYSST